MFPGIFTRLQSDQPLPLALSRVLFCNDKWYARPCMNLYLSKVAQHRATNAAIECQVEHSVVACKTKGVQVYILLDSRYQCVGYE